MNKSISAEFFALGAAFLNGTIGVLTRFGLNDTHHSSIAFWKCFGAFLLLCVITLLQPTLRLQVINQAVHWKKLALLAFLGIFCLYSFETWAFSEAAIPLVSFLTYAAGIVTLLLSVWFLQEKMTLSKTLALLAIAVGISLLFLFEGNVSGSYLGIFLAILGGLGYALFIFFSKLFALQGGLVQLVWLFGFGSLFLSIPFGLSGAELPTMSGWWVIGALILLPTIGGFYCTSRAVASGEASKVQIIETTDPLFSALFAFLLFGDLLSPIGFIGAIAIFVGLLLSLKK